jgi:hypothetical protein
MYWRRAHDTIEAIKSSVRLDSNDGVVDVFESIKSGVRLKSNNGVVDVVVPIDHDYKFNAI